MNYIHALFNKLLNGLFPIACFGCKRQGTYICTDCASKMPRTAHNEERFLSVFQYGDPSIRALLQSLKYKGGSDVAERCAEMLYEHICEELGELALLYNFAHPLIVPVPLHEKRLRERGFNQAELIARAFAALDASFVLCRDALVRIKNTESQTKMKNKEERIKNVHGCFAVHNPEKIKGGNIILIDDIYTTGATLREARAALKKSGAREVLCLTVAH